MAFGCRTFALVFLQLQRWRLSVCLRDSCWESIRADLQVEPEYLIPAAAPSTIHSQRLVGHECRSASNCRSAYSPQRNQRQVRREDRPCIGDQPRRLLQSRAGSATMLSQFSIWLIAGVAAATRPSANHARPQVRGCRVRVIRALHAAGTVITFDRRKLTASRAHYSCHVEDADRANVSAHVFPS